jgi:uncharacterized protein CbrC (UPF0167 family)
MCIDDGRVVSNFVAQVNMRTAVYSSYRAEIWLMLICCERKTVFIRCKVLLKNRADWSCITEINSV